jgi:CBS-domain-containing membrane protein
MAAKKSAAMHAKEVMTRDVVTVGPDTPVREIAERLLAHRISAVPVVDGAGKLLGIVSEGDLMRRPESGTERRGSWWLGLFDSSEDRLREFAKSRGQRARDVMTREVVSVGERTPLDKVAALLEKRRIKRVPVVRGGKLVGIVSRANLLRGLVAEKRTARPSPSDPALRKKVLAAIRTSGARSEFIDVVVSGGVVHLWGGVYSQEDRAAIRAAAESTPGVKGLEDNLGIFSPMVRATMWGG